MFEETLLDRDVIDERSIQAFKVIYLEESAFPLDYAVTARDRRVTKANAAGRLVTIT